MPRCRATSPTSTVGSSDWRSAARSADLDVQPLLGELLPDWYDDWVLAERETLRLRRIAALEHLADELLGRGRYAQATEAALAG